MRLEASVRRVASLRELGSAPAAAWMGGVPRWRPAGISLRAGLPRQHKTNYQVITRRGRQCGVDVWPHPFRHHFSHTWLDRGGPEGDLMELNGWSSPQMLTRYGASALSVR